MNEPLLIFTKIIGIFPLVIYFFNKKVNKVTVYLLPFIFLTAFGSLYELIGTDLLKLQTKYWFRIYMFFEFFTILYFYYKLLQYKIIYTLLAVLYLLIYFYLLIDWSPSQKGFNDLPLNIIITLVVVFSSCLWFVGVFTKLEDKPLYERTDFFYISSLLIYFTGTFLVFLMADYLSSDPNYKILDYWTLIVVFNLILRTTLIFTVWKAQIKLEH